jgi:hypothetical protein
LIGGLGLVAALAIGAAAPTAAEAENFRGPAPSVFPVYPDPWRTAPAPAPSVFPVYPDPWRTQFRHHPGFGHQPRVFVAPQPVWVRPYWAWNGYTWVWIPGYWAY